MTARVILCDTAQDQVNPSNVTAFKWEYEFDC